MKRRVKGGSGELQACQPDLGSREDYEQDHLECHHMACAGQAGNKAQPARVYEKQVLLDQSGLFL